MTTEIPGTKFLCSNSVDINPWPWTLFIVKSCLSFSSDPATMCSSFMYILPCYVFTRILFIPVLTPIALLFSLTNAMTVTLYIKTLSLYDILMFKYRPWSLSHCLLNPHLDPPWNLYSGLPGIPFHSRDLASYSTSTLPSLWTTLSSGLLLNSRTTSDTSRNPQSPQNTPKILGHEYEVVRCSAQAEANVWNPSWLQVE